VSVHSRRPRLIHVAVLVVAGLVLAAVAVGANVLGVADRIDDVARRIELAIDPPPDRPIEEEMLVTARPVAPETPDVAPTPAPTLGAGKSAPPATLAPTPVPERVAVDVDLYRDPEHHWITELDHEWCAVAGTQMVLAAHDRAPLTEAFQKELAGRIGEWESRRDSHNGGWGPAAIVAALEAYGVEGYEVRTYETRADALRDAARAIATYRAPVVLLTWRGAHTWVMTGFQADADPLVFDDARVVGAYILDPWYPRVSSIWGASDPPGTFQDAAEMRRNYLPWKRPDGLYPKRDGRFLAILPTRSIDQ